MADHPPFSPRFRVAGRYFDGQQASDAAVEAEVDSALCKLSILGHSENDGQPLLAQWDLDDLRIVRDAGHRNGIAFHPVHEPEARLLIPSATDAARLGEVAPRLHKAHVARGTMRRVLLWVSGAAAALALLLVVILPNLADTMARFVPPHTEEAIGRTVLAQVTWITRTAGSQSDLTCAAPAGQAALEKLGARLSAGLDLPYPLKLQVVRNPMVNALAAPGGYILFFSGLIDKADSAEEVAGVLAHEIGHVANRDPLRIVLRGAGSTGILSMVLGDVTGGAMIVLAAQQLVSASYTRTAEAAADAFALDLLRQAGLPSEAFAVFFEKLRKEYGDTPAALAYFATHPNLQDRADAARATSPTDTPVRPALTDTEWAALQAICTSG